jgi:hypothetical protein
MAAVVVDAVFEQGCRSVCLEARGAGGGPLEARLLDRVAAIEERCDARGDAHRGGNTMRGRAVILAAAIVMAPLGARGADLVVWWEEGQAAEEDEAVREIIAAFEQNTGNQVELFLGPQEAIASDLVAAIEAGRLIPDFVFTVADTALRAMGLRGSARRPRGCRRPFFRPV